MATRTDMACSLGLKVATGQTAQGSPVYSTRTINNIETTASDNDLFGFGTAYANLQVHALGKIIRTDKATLVQS